MRVVGTVIGRGQVEIAGRLVGEIDYEIEVRERNGVRRASGVATHSDVGVIETASHAGTSILHLANGGSVAFVITHVTASGAIIQIKGPAPTL